MNYTVKTLRAVEDFLRKKGSATQSELRMLGTGVEKIRHNRLKSILKDLENDRKITYDKIKFGKLVLKRIVWVKK
jgi:hypothetical protein